MTVVSPDVPTIITGFFDIGREHWGRKVDGTLDAPWLSDIQVPESFARTNQLYLDRFAYLAAIKNPMVIFTEDRFCQFVHGARARHGMDGQTWIVDCTNPFRTSTSLDYAIERTRLAISRPEYGALVARPHCPEHWNPHYVAMMMFKFTIVSSAIRMGLVQTASLAWIDFGYCTDDQRFDKHIPWSFKCSDKVHLFYIREPDNKPIFDIVRSGDVYFMGCHMVSPAARWTQFFGLVENAFDSLLDCGIPDDDQTALLMAYRRMPSLFQVHAIDPSDWFVIFRQRWT